MNIFDLIGTFFPAIVMFLLFRGIFQTIFGKKRRRQQPQELPPDYEYEEQEALDNEPVEQKKPDLASEFERRLRKHKENQQRRDDAKIEAEPEVLTCKSPKVTTDDKVKQRVHRWGEAYKHDKSKVYYDPRGDYSYNEEKANAEAAAFRLKPADAPKQPKVKLRHKELVNGFIMAQVLAKPRSLKPYGDEELL